MDGFFDHVTNISDEEYKNLVLDLKTIFEESFDTIYVTDGDGNTMRVSSSGEHIFGCKPEELIGRNVYDMEKKGIYRPSSTRLAIEKKQKIQTLQQTASGRKLYVITVPIMQDGIIKRVISISKDITDTFKLEKELVGTRKLLWQYYEGKIGSGNENFEEKKLVYSSKKMGDLAEYVQRVARFDSTILILGESGVGKEIFARMIHDFSQRIGGPFVKINCGAIPENLLESELFGYEKGAFTGAIKTKPGLFQEANEGTLFLDEIGELPLQLQVKLLRVIQERECMRIGGTKPIMINVRIIAATNRDLEEMVANGTFRKDLYYRLNIVPVSIPPLRERQEDIITLTSYFLDKYNKKFERNVIISKEVTDALVIYEWPGNVRELENLVERLVITSRNGIVKLDDLPPNVLMTDNNSFNTIQINSIVPLQQALSEVEDKMIELALKKYRTTTAAAKVLGVSQSTVSRKRKTIRQFGEN